MVVDIDRLIRGLQRAEDDHDIAALIYVSPLIEALKDNPRKAIEMIPKVYDAALNQAYTGEDGKNDRAFVECVAGGPYEVIPWSIYNSVGAVYPYLDRELRDLALKGIFQILDKLNFGDVNGERGAGHTTGMREPLLLADVGIARVFYWPGMDEGKWLIKEFGNFFDFQKVLVKEDGTFRHVGKVNEGERIRGVNSDFIVAYSLLRKDFCDWGENYLKIVNPDFLNRVMKGIVALRFARCKDKEEISQGRKRLEELLPKILHEKIELLRLEEDWTHQEFR